MIHAEWANFALASIMPYAATPPISAVYSWNNPIVVRNVAGIMWRPTSAYAEPNKNAVFNIAETGMLR